MRWKIRRPSEPKLFFLSTFSRWILFLFLTQTFSSWPYHYFPQLFSQLIILGWIRNTLLSQPQSQPECPVGVQFIIQSAHDHSRSHLRVCACVCGCVCECAVVSLKPSNFSYTQQLKTKHWRNFAQHLHQIIEDSLGPLMHAWSFHSLHCELKFPSIHTICNKKGACAGKLWCFDLILILALFLFNTFKR